MDLETGSLQTATTTKESCFLAEFCLLRDIAEFRPNSYLLRVGAHRMTRKAKATVGLRIGRQVWLDTARMMLIIDGVERVRVERIADKLGAKRGGIYWHFANRKALLDENCEQPVCPG